jgi:hypothetical protein
MDIAALVPPPPVVPLPVTATPLVALPPTALPLAPAAETVGVAAERRSPNPQSSDARSSGGNGGSARDRHDRAKSTAAAASPGSGHRLDILA